MARTEGAVRRGGHRHVPHTADLRVEAWAPTREECPAHAVRGVCESFVDLSGAVGRRRREAEGRAETDEDLPVALLDEVVYRLDADGEVPAAVPGGMRGERPIRRPSPQRVSSVRARVHAGAHRRDTLVICTHPPWPSPVVCVR